MVESTALGIATNTRKYLTFKKKVNIQIKCCRNKKRFKYISEINDKQEMFFYTELLLFSNLRMKAYSIQIS